MQRTETLPAAPLRAVLIAVLVLFAAAAPSPAQQFAFDPLWDGVAAGAGILLAGGSELFLQHRAPPDLGEADLSDVNAFDRAALFPYSREFDLASTAFEITSCLIPLGLVFLLPSDQWIAATVVYAEAMSAAVVLKNAVKYLFPRYRPYLYPGGTVNGSPPGSDGTESFLSGHATVAFAAATFGIVLFATYAPDSPYLVPVIAGSAAVAALTASFRVLGGMHFLTDVIAGAALGVACGCLVPLLHRTAAGLP